MIATAPQVAAAEMIGYAQEGYGGWTIAPHQGPVRFDLMPADYQQPAENQSEQLLHFFAITDIHITDGEFQRPTGSIQNMAAGLYQCISGSTITATTSWMGRFIRLMPFTIKILWIFGPVHG